MLDDFSVIKHKEPVIVYRHKAFEAFGDMPYLYRWRATWDDSYDTNVPVAVVLDCYPVRKITNAGVWIDPSAYWSEGWEDQPGGWITHEEDCWRWVHNLGNASWAKGTRKEALRSLAIRLARWSRHVRHNVERLNAACDVANAVLKDYSGLETFDAFKIGKEGVS